jgi:galactokinase
MQQLGCAATAGFRLLLDSSVPEGKGVASSAALEVAALSALSAGSGFPVSGGDLAAACQWVENHVVGAPCGIMDQMTSACGRRNRLLRLRCQPATIEGYLEIPAGYRFYGIDSGIRHAVSGVDYGTVRTAAFMGYRMLSELTELDGYLANLPAGEFAARFERSLPERMSGAEFQSSYPGLTDSATRVNPERHYPVRQATAHPIYEQERVERFARLLGELPQRPAAAEELGELMDAAHRSYGACGLGSAATDHLVALVTEAGPSRGLFGAKLTGGGSGGTVAVFAAEAAAPVVRELAARYRAERGSGGTLFSGSGPGAFELGALLIGGR